MVYPLGGVGVFEALADTLQNGLLGWWKLDETSGSTANDSGPNGYDGANSNVTINQTGHIDKAYSFNGSSSIVDITGETIGTGDYTLSAWIKTTNTDAYNAIFGIGAYAPAFYTSNGEELLVYDGGDIVSNTIADLDDGDWHHVAFVRSGTGSGELAFYFDGSAVGTATHSDNITSTSWAIGDSGYSGENFDGLLDDVRLYERALSSSEIQALANM